MKSFSTIVGVAALTAGSLAAAQERSVPEYPTKPIRFIVPFAGGGGLDLTARMLGSKLTDKWGVNVVVDTRPGAATIVGTEIASKAAPDGYTVLMITTTFAINPSLYPKLPYDPNKDFAPITQLNSQPNVIVVPASSPIATVKELVALAKAKPGALTFATPGAGSAPHLSAELLKRTAGIDMIHVPYKGIPAAVTDVLSGRVGMLFTTTLSAAPFVAGGKMKAVALTSGKRLETMHDVPTVGETIKGYEAEAFQGMIAPAGVPRPIIEKLAREVAAAIRQPDMTKSFIASGAVPVGSTPAQFGAFLRAETVKWARVIQDAGIKLEQ